MSGLAKPTQFSNDTNVSYCLPKAYSESPEGQALLRKIEETISDKKLTFARVVDLQAYVEQAYERGMRNPKRLNTKSGRGTEDDLTGSPEMPMARRLYLAG